MLTLGSFGYQNDFSLGPPGLIGTADNDNDNDLSLGQFLDLHYVD